MRLRRVAGLVALATLVAGACAPAESSDPASSITTATITLTTTTTTFPPGNSTSPWPIELGDEHQDWTVRIVRVLNHDPGVFTQGLEQTAGGILESTGLRNQSTLRLVDEITGEVLASRPLDDELFGEGLTVVGNEVIQLTWTSETALRYDAESLELFGSHRYGGEGWGLCYDETVLWMSNGSAQLTRRDPQTFEPLGEVAVRRDGTLVDQLNELECVDGRVIANVWKSSEIIVIDPVTGVVQATIDAAPLLADVRPDLDPDLVSDQAVLNGIADLGDGTLLLGGKWWPRHFVVALVAPEGS